MDTILLFKEHRIIALPKKNRSSVYSAMMLLFAEIFCPMLFMLTGGPGPLLEIQVSNIKYDKGSIMVAIYDDPDEFLKDGAVFTTTYAVSVSGSVLIPVDGLRPGKYAVSVFHDVNSNHKLDTNFLGIPSEPIGFSNNARGKMGPPRFEDAVCTITGGSQILTLTLR